MKIFQTLLAMLIFSFILPANAFSGDKIALIANKDSKLKEVDIEMVKRLFLGEASFVGATRPILGDRKKDSALRRDFYLSIAGLDLDSVSRHWAKKIFTGKASPLHRISGSDDDAKEWVKDDSNRISYIYKKNVDPTVKVLTTID